MCVPLDIKTIATCDLSPADRTAWLRLRANDPALESPYHHPDYHRLVDAHQGGGKLTLAHRSEKLIAVLPWQGKSFARPSGAPLSDYQTLIAAPDVQMDGTQIDFETLLRGQAVGAFHYTAIPDPVVGGSDGARSGGAGSKAVETARLELVSAAGWRGDRDSSYRRHLKSTRRRVRKAETDIGAPRIILQSRDIDAYQALMRWKRDKFRETGKFDVLANPGTSGLLRALWERGPKAELRADLHVLYFGDRIAAADLGLTDGHVFHSWIVGYDPELLAYAPGIQLLEAVIDAAEPLGYGVIDLGPGTDGYKRHYATHPRYVRAGVATVPSAAGLLAASYDRAERALRAPTGDMLGKVRRRYSQIAACESGLAARSRALADAVGHHIRT